jgi:hypothetical protein
VASELLPNRGYGDLARYLESHGLRCVYRGDIRTCQDALKVDAYNDADVIITNPPYSRELMHPLILHFQHIAPTWLLIDADWAHTKQALPLLPACSHIVGAGRASGSRTPSTAARTITLGTALTLCIRADQSFTGGGSSRTLAAPNASARSRCTICALADSCLATTLLPFSIGPI